MSEPLYARPATEMIDLLHRREVAPSELVDVAADRIESVHEAVNALPIQCLDRAREQAKQLESRVARESPGEIHTILGGLPIAVKDYNDVGGVRTTYGSPVYADHVPRESDATVARLELNGAIPVAKANVPEWAGGHTFNPVFGATRNPWNLGRSAGGSSGGSAAALATGQVWLATGNDLGGSLRTPASFNAVVGLRPGPGLVPRGKRLLPFDSLWVEGPMGRTVADVALMLDAGAGAHPDDPLSFDSAPMCFTRALTGTDLPKRIGFSRDLGIAPMAREVGDLCEAAARKLGTLGATVADECPSFAGAFDGFQTLRGVLIAVMMESILDEHRDRIAPEIIGNIEKGLNVTPAELLAAERIRWALYHRMVAFFEDYDLLVCPAASVLPFPIEQRYVTDIDGVACESYIDWFMITFALTMTSCPVVSMPCGFSASGLPVGIQVVGKPRGEAALLRAAHRMEEIFGVAKTLPIDPKGPC